MGAFDDFAEFAKPNEPLAPLTWFRLGGPAAYLARPTNLDQLTALIQRGRQESIPWRVLSGGSNILVRDAGFAGLAIHLESPAFSDVLIQQDTIKVGAAVPLTALCSQAARAGLAGLEILTGIPGSVGGCLMSDSNGRDGSLMARVKRIEILDKSGEIRWLDAEDFRFLLSDEQESEDQSRILLSAELTLTPENPEAVVRRMRRIWILKRERQPYGHQSSGYLFKDPSPERSAAMVIEQAGLKGFRIGNVEISDRNANFGIVHPGATADDVLRLVDHVREQVFNRYRQELQLHIRVW